MLSSNRWAYKAPLAPVMATSILKDRPFYSFGHRPGMMASGWPSRKPVWEGLVAAPEEIFKITCVRARLSQKWNVVCRGKTILALLLVIPAGCSTVPTDNSEEATPAPEPEVMVATTTPILPVQPVPVPMPVPVPVIAPTATATATATATVNPAAPDEPWISLEQWSEANGFGALQRAAGEPTPTYFFNSTNGTMAVRMGSQLAHWNGLEYRLGFAPQLIDGHPFVHPLDARKNFAPLLDNASHAQARHVIVIDPGHGGTDIGTRGASSTAILKRNTRWTGRGGCRPCWPATAGRSC